MKELSGEIQPEPRSGGAADECTDEAHPGFSGAKFGRQFAFSPEASEGVCAGIAGFDANDDGSEGKVAEFFSRKPAELGGECRESTCIEEDDEVCSEGFDGVSGGVKAESFVGKED